MGRPATGQIVPPRGGRGYALRVRAYGRREYVTLGKPEDGWTPQRVERELAATLRDIDAGTWAPPAARPTPVAPADPSFHEFASDWFAMKRREIRPNTISSYRNDLTRHLLPFFAEHRLSQITIAEVDRYRQSKVREGAEVAAAAARGEPRMTTVIDRHGRHYERREKPLSARSINMQLSLLAQILEVAVEYGHLDRNPASGRRRRLKAERPRPVHLDSASHLAVLLEAADRLDAAQDARTSGRAAAICVLLFAGLRAEEVGGLTWRDIDLANSRLYVGRSKTSAGVREVDLLPLLLDVLKRHKLASASTGLDDPVFVTSTGKIRDRHNIRQRVVAPIANLADELLAERDLQPLPAGITPHKLRHTFASLLAALGNDPAYVMAQLGHTDPAFTLRVYTHMMRREAGEREALSTLVNGGDWAASGQQPVALPVAASAPRRA